MNVNNKIKLVHANRNLMIHSQEITKDYVLFIFKQEMGPMGIQDAQWFKDIGLPIVERSNYNILCEIDHELPNILRKQAS